MKQQVKVLLERGAFMPKYAHDGDLGMDVTAIAFEYDAEHDAFMYHTGIHMESAKDLGCFVMLRSSNKKTEYYLANQVGLVETFLYRGEICLAFKHRDSLDTRIANATNIIWNTIPWYKKFFKDYNKIMESVENHMLANIRKEAPYRIGERIGQLVFLNFPEVELVQVDKLSKTERGTGGFGSTGK